MIYSEIPLSSYPFTHPYSFSSNPLINEETIEMELSCDNKTFLGKTNSIGQRYIVLDRSRYDSVDTLIQKHPEILKKKYLNIFVYLLNFLLKGKQYQLIEDAEGYKKSYLQRIKDEKENICLDPFLSFCNNTFDIKEISSPTLEVNSNNETVKITFYATQGQTPYRVTYIPPSSESPSQCAYEILTEKFY